MPRYKSFNHEALVSGHAMVAFNECSMCENIRKHLEKHDLMEIDPHAWYPLQQWLDVFSDIGEELTAMTDFVSIGMAIANRVPLERRWYNMPFDQAMALSNQIYYSEHRGDAGTLEVRLVKPGHLRIIAFTPYPDDFLYGFNYGLGKRFLPEGHLMLKYDTDEPRRDDGGRETVLHVWWEEPGVNGNGHR